MSAVHAFSSRDPPAGAEAALYDWHNDAVLRDQRRDELFWLDRLGPIPRRVAVYGAGTGRIAAPLNWAGHAVVAIDHDRARLARVPAGPAIVCADFCEPLDFAVDEALFPYSALQMVRTPDRRIAALASAASAVGAAGRVSVDTSERFAQRADRGWHVAANGWSSEFGAEVIEMQRHRRGADALRIDTRYEVSGRFELCSTDHWAFYDIRRMTAEAGAAGLKVADVQRGYNGYQAHRAIYTLVP